MFSRIEQIVSADTDNPIELARIAGCDLKRFFRGAKFEGVDVRGLDLRAYDLTGADFSGIIADLSTQADKEFLHEIRAHAIMTLVDSIDGKVGDENYLDYREELLSLRLLSEAENIGLSGALEKYFQDAPPFLRGWYAVDFNDDDIAKAKYPKLSDDLQGRFIEVALDVSAPKNTPPADKCRITAITTSTNVRAIVVSPTVVVFGRDDGCKNYEADIKITVQTQAVPGVASDYFFTLSDDGVRMEFEEVM